LFKFKLLILTLILITISIFARDNIIINSGHSHPVESFSSNGKILYSCDKRGTLMVWDTNQKILIKKLQISYLQVRNITVNSDGTKLAVVETDTISSFKLSVWDLEKGEKLFSHKMDGLPLFIDFSPKDSYLIYSKTDWNSLTFLDSQKGFEVPLMFEDYGIVSSAYITASEKTLLFYNPSGTIQYWNLLNGEIKTSPIKTRRDLSSINITEDGAYMTCSDSNNLYLINLQNGKTLASIKTTGILSSSIIANSRELVILKKENNKFEISIWKITTTKGKEELRRIKSIELPSTIMAGSGFTIIENIIYLAGKNGEIFSLNLNTELLSTLSENILASISDLQLINGKLILATENNIISMGSDIFTESLNIEDKLEIELIKYNNPFKEETGIVTDNYDFFIYPKDNKKGELKKFNNGEFTTIGSEFTSPFISVEYLEGNFISLEKDGSSQIINSYTGASTFKYSSFGINSIESVFGNNLIAGRNRTAFLQSPLLHINPETEEVVPIEESNIIIFKMDYDSITRTLYTLGFEERKSGLITVLKAHTGSAWELTDTIMTYPGEDQTGSFVVDESKSRIYLSIGNSGLVMYGWDGFTDMENTNHIPKKLYISNDLLISLNTDSTLSMWNTINGRLLANFYILKNGEWIITTANDKIFLSKKSLDYLIH
jgi:hypothetical protein